ncbi:MAG: hypothetical protein LBH43_10650 [Treponema sp.]|jgi:hypothetical protein|nr:hypothetical protein [Treponema sp.]
MSEEITITFFQIHKCGFYKGGKKQFGSIGELLPDLKKWAESVRYMVDTRLSGDEKEGDASDECREVFYYDYCENKDSSLLVLWNRLPDVIGAVPTLSIKKQIGDGIHCTVTDLPKDSIPGTASYFWFLPQQNCFATIARKNKTSNVKGMRKYLQTFLATRSSYCNTGEDGKEITSYKDQKGKDVSDVTPYFQASLAQRKGQIDYIKANRQKIRKIIRKQKITKNLKVRLDIGKSLLVTMGVKKPRLGLIDFNTSYAVSYTPTEAELKEIIKEWEDTGVTEYDDTGFVLSRDTKTHWLGGEISRIKKDWELAYIDDEILNPQELLKSLDYCKNELAAVLT